MNNLKYVFINSIMKKLAIIGATGLVGREMLKILYERKLIKSNKIFLYASKNSANKIIKIKNYKFVVKELCEENLEKKYDYVLFSAGKDVSKNWAKRFVDLGAVVIDNSSAFRRENDIPLIVPEINSDVIKNKKLISNPNCSTIGLSIPLYAISQKYKIKKIIVSTYQAVSGAGQKGILDLKKNTNNKFKYKIKNNLIPQIDEFLPNGYTYEEDKMNFELKRVLKNKKLKITATCVRVPLVNSHSESVYIELDKEPDISLIIKRLKNTNGIKVIDDIKNLEYPMPLYASGMDDICVGRIRKDETNNKAINMFISFDNIRKGAALNAIQIMQFLIIKNKLKKALPKY